MNVQNVNEILDALARRFGAMGGHLWDLLVRQQELLGQIGAGLWLMALTMWIVAIVIAFR